MIGIYQKMIGLFNKLMSSKLAGPFVAVLRIIKEKTAPVFGAVWSKIGPLLKAVTTKLRLDTFGGVLAGLWANRKTRVVILLCCFLLVLSLAVFKERSRLEPWLQEKGLTWIPGTSGSTVEVAGETAGVLTEEAVTIVEGPEGGEPASVTPEGAPDTAGEVPGATAGEGMTGEAAAIQALEVEETDEDSGLESLSEYYWNLKYTVDELERIIYPRGKDYGIVDGRPGNYRAFTMLTYTRLQIADEYLNAAYKKLKTLHERRLYSHPEENWLKNLFPPSVVKPKSCYLILNEALPAVKQVMDGEMGKEQLWAGEVFDMVQEAYSQYDCALDILQDMKEHYEKSSWPYQVEGLLLQALGEESEALKVLEVGAGKFKDARCANAAGTIHLLKVDRALSRSAVAYALSQAKPWLEKAVRWDPKLAQARNNLGLVLLMESELKSRALPPSKRPNFSTAQKQLDRAVKLHKNKSDDRSRGNLAVVYYYQGRNKRYAEKEIRQAYGREPSTSENVNNIGCMEIQWGDSRLSLEHFKEAVFWNPTSSILWNNYGFAHLVLGELDEARTIFKKAGVTPDILLNLSFTYLKMKEKSMQVAAPQRQQEIEPGAIIEAAPEEMLEEL